MTWGGLLIAFGLPTLCGYFLVESVLGKASNLFYLEKLLLGFGAGIWILTLEMFLMGIAAVAYTPAAISAVLVITTVLMALIRYFFPGLNHGPGTALPPERSGPLWTIFGILLILWIGWKIGFVLYEGFNRPILAQDSWENWSGGAKFFFYNQGLLLDRSNEHFFGMGYRTYMGHPLLNSLAQVWTSLMLGEFHESLAKAWVPFYFIGILGLLFFSVKREAGRVAAIISAFILSSAPLITYHATEALSDMPLAFYVLAGSLLLWRYFEGGKHAGPRTVALSGLFFSMGAFTKTEGLVYIFSASAAIIAYNIIEKESRWKDLVCFILPAVLFIAPWLIFKAYHGIGYGHGYGTESIIGDAFGEIRWTQALHIEVIGIFFKEMLLAVDHALIFPFLGLITILGFRTILNTNIKYLYMIIIIVISAFLFVYTTTIDYIGVINRTHTHRNILTFVPLAFLTASILASRLLRRYGEPKEE